MHSPGGPHTRRDPHAFRPWHRGGPGRFLILAGALAGLGWQPAADAWSPEQTPARNEEQTPERNPVPAPGASPAQNPAQTGTDTRQFAIPAGPLADALTRFGAQAGIALAGHIDLVRDKTSPGLNGRFGIPQGLDRLLEGSGLEARLEAGGSYSLRRRPPPAVSTAPTPTLSTVMVTAQAERTGSTDGTGSYAGSTTSVGKGQQALKDVPQTITVISRQRIEDQGLWSIDDVMTQAAGISMTTNGIYGSSYTARGLSVNKFRYDGGTARRHVTYTRAGEEDMAPFDHVEVLRGADGLFSGAGEAGGVVNLTYKRPAPVFRASADLTVGSWRFRRAEADVSGPLAFDGRLRGRLVAAHQDRDYFYDHGGRRSSVLYGALETDLGADTRLFAGIDHQQVDERGTSWGHPRYSDGTRLAVDRRRNFTVPWSWAKTGRTTTFAQLEHALPSDWRLQFRLEHHDAATDHHTARLGGPIDPAVGTGRYWGASWDGDIEHLAADLLVKGSFGWLGRRHDVTFGMDWSRTHSRFLFRNPDFGGYVTSPIDPLVVPPMPEQMLGGPWEITSTRNTQHGLYAALHLRPVEHWTLITGIRYVLRDRNIEQRLYPEEPADSTLTRRNDDGVLVPYLGVVRALDAATNVYASATEIYSSQATNLGGPLPGSPLAPVRGSNYELGVKHALSDRLAASLALYRIEKKGMAVRDPSFPATEGELGSSCCFHRDGYQLSEGVDLELNGELLPGWQASLGYAWNSNVNRRDSDARFSTSTPRHLFKLWTQYQFRDRWHPLSLGAGVVAQSSSYNSGSVNRYNPASGRYDGESVSYRFHEGGRAVWSARAEYRLSRHLSLSLNVNNLFDKTYFRSVGTTTNGNYYGEPRNVMVRLRVQ